MQYFTLCDPEAGEHGQMIETIGPVSASLELICSSVQSCIGRAPAMSTSSVMRPLSWPYHGESAPGHGPNLCAEIWCAEDLRSSFPNREINEPGAIHFAHTRKQKGTSYTMRRGEHQKKK
jgi:hypothetical protein